MVMEESRAYRVNCEDWKAREDPKLSQTALKCPFHG
jgi:hypothetical protein